MLDIGIGELLVIAVLALLIFGPDRLPRAAADAARVLRQVRQAAVSARRDLVDASGLGDDPELMRAVSDLRDLDPRRAMSGVLDEEPARPASRRGAAAGSASPAGGDRPGEPAAGRPGPAGQSGVPAVDPDWT